MPADWYTVPKLYGGRSLPFWRRVAIEYRYRRDGEPGLVRYVDAMRDRATIAIVRMTKAFEDLRVQNQRARFAFAGLREEMEKTRWRRSSG